MIFEQFENYLKNIQLPQKILIYFIPVLLVSGLIFFYIAPEQEDKLEILQSQNIKLQASIKRKAPKNIKKEIKRSKSKLLAEKEKREKTRDALNFLYAKLTNMEILEFNEQQWTATLDAILKKSLELNIKIKHIKNSDSEHNNKSEKIVPKKYVEIIGSGKYSNTLKYLHFIENREFLVDVKNIKMQKKEDSNDIDFHFNFTIYGVNI